MTDQIGLLIFEGGKLVLQFFGALLIAWLTVRWALKRYKAEKHWERRLAAYTDLLSAIGSLNQVLWVWEDAAITQRDRVIGDNEQDLRKRYWQARRELRAAIAVSELLLPAAAVKAIEDLERGLSNAGNTAQSTFDHLDNQIGAVHEARNAIVTTAKKDLGLTLP